MLDGSSHGCAILSKEELKRGSLHTLELDTPYGVVKCNGEVRYCRPCTEHPGNYRIGMRIDTMARIDHGRWLRTLQIDEDVAA